MGWIPDFGLADELRSFRDLYVVFMLFFIPHGLMNLKPLYSSSPKVGNSIASILKSNV